MFATTTRPRPKTPIVPAFPTVPTSGRPPPWRARRPARARDPLGLPRLRRAGSGTARSPAPVRRPGRRSSRPLSYPPVVYQESVQIPVPDERHLPAARQGHAIPAVPQNGTVSRPRQRVRGMNAALETGVAGVGEMAPARQPARPRQMVLAVVVAIIGLAAGALTYKSLATGSVSFSGEVVPTHVYALSFGRRHDHGGQSTPATTSARPGARHPGQRPGPANLRRRMPRPPAAALYADEHRSGPASPGTGRGHGGADLPDRRHRSRVSHGRPRKAIISQRQQAVTLDKRRWPPCGTATTSATCQALAAKLSTAQQVTQAQTPRQDRQLASSRSSGAEPTQRTSAALQQVQSQASGVSVTLDQARQRLAAAKVTVAQDEIALKAHRSSRPRSAPSAPSRRRPR